MPRPDFLRAGAAGVLAGVLASAAMNGFQAVWNAATGAATTDEPTTVKAADRLAEATTGAKVPERYRAAADPAVHYATGVALGVALEGARRLLRGAGLRP